MIKDDELSSLSPKLFTELNKVLRNDSAEYCVMQA